MLFCSSIGQRAVKMTNMADTSQKKEVIITGSVKTVLLTFVALIGFMAGVSILLSQHDAFHEIEYQPAIVVDSILSFYEAEAARDTSFHSAQQDTMLQEIHYRRHLITELSDSMIKCMLIDKQLFINADSFTNECLIDFSVIDSTRQITRPIVWDYYITHSFLFSRYVSPGHYQRHVRNFATTYPQNMDFFTAYPGFVLWVLLLIIQYCLFPVLAVFACVAIRNFRRLYPEADVNRTGKMIINVVLAMLVTSSYVIISFFAFFHPNLMTNGLFYKNMYVALGVIASITAITGVCCFTGFMLISNISINDSTKERDALYYKKMLGELNSLFSALLIVASVALSLIVLTTGVLYTSINSMDFVQKITDDLGYSPFAYRYVLLIAVLSSLLLSLFMIPAKLRLRDIERKINKAFNESDPADHPLDIAGILKGLLLIGLPIIISMLHFLVSLFTN